MNRKSKLMVLVVVGLMLLSVSATFAQDAVTITLWSRDSDQTLVRALADAWNASHTNQVDVTIIPADQFVTRFATAAAGGEVPDLLPIDLIYIPQFAQAGQLTEIGDMAKALPYFDQLSPSHIRLSTYNNGLYALPFATEGSVLLYNKGLFKQAGLDPDKPPTTWQEIHDDATAIHKLGSDYYGFYYAGACAGCNAFTFLPLIWASGGDVLSADGTKATLDDPTVKAALTLYQQMWKEGLVPPSAQADSGADFLNAFLGGKIGMAGSGAFAISTLKNEHPEIDLGVTPLPGQKGGSSSFAGGDSISIPAGAQHVKEGFEFIQWVLSDDVQLEMYAKTGQIPVRTDLAKNKYFDADPRLTTIAQAMATGRTPYSFVYNQLFNDPNGPWLQMIQTAIFNGDVDGAIATAQQSFTTILSESAATPSP